MRNLTIKRTKSFVACLMKIKIYIEDPTSNEILINNTPCRKIGDLKNGEEKTFQIPEQAAKIYVIADKFSKNYCNEYYQLPEGQDDISLSGKNKFNPANGNAFRFDNNESEGIIANRKKGTRKGIGVLIAALIIGVIVGLVIGFLSVLPEDKTFSSDGMTITLTDSFHKTDMENFDIVYDSKNVAVFIDQNAFTAANRNYTPEEYAEILAVSESLGSGIVKTVDELIYFEYDFTNPETNVDYRSVTYVYKSSDAFWVVQFITSMKDADDYAKEIQEWAKSIRFAE